MAFLFAMLPKLAFCSRRCKAPAVDVEPLAPAVTKTTEWKEQLSTASTAAPTDCGPMSCDSQLSWEEDCDMGHFFGEQLSARLLREHTKRCRETEQEDFGTFLRAFKKAAAEIAEGQVDAVDRAFGAYAGLQACSGH